MKINLQNNLKEVREFLGLTQSELARKSALQPSAINHFESGRREPNIQNLAKLARALGVTTDRLLFGVKNGKE